MRQHPANLRVLGLLLIPCCHDLTIVRWCVVNLISLGPCLPLFVSRASSIARFGAARLLSLSFVLVAKRSRIALVM